MDASHQCSLGSVPALCLIVGCVVVVSCLVYFSKEFSSLFFLLLEIKHFQIQQQQQQHRLYFHNFKKTLMHFSDYTSHSAPLFACSGILPIKMLYFKLVASLLHDIENHCAPPNISQLFTRSEQVHSYSTRFSVAGSSYIK